MYFLQLTYASRFLECAKNSVIFLLSLGVSEAMGHEVQRDARCKVYSYTSSVFNRFTVGIRRSYFLVRGHKSNGRLADNLRVLENRSDLTWRWKWIRFLGESTFCLMPFLFRRVEIQISSRLTRDHFGADRVSPLLDPTSSTYPSRW